MIPTSKAAEKRERILHGLRELCAEQTQTGQTYSAEQIARRCGCSAPAIEQIEWRAREIAFRKLLSLASEYGLDVPKKILFPKKPRARVKAISP